MNVGILNIGILIVIQDNDMEDQLLNHFCVSWTADQGMVDMVWKVPSVTSARFFLLLQTWAQFPDCFDGKVFFSKYCHWSNDDVMREDITTWGLPKDWSVIMPPLKLCPPCHLYESRYMGGNLLTVQSMEMMSYFLFLLATVFRQFRGLESQEMKYFLKIY